MPYSANPLGHRTRRRPMSEINVVPYIDVMLVLLVIFMVTAPLLYQGVDVDLPQVDAQAEQDPPQEPLIVSVDADGRYYLNMADDPEAPLDRGELSRAVMAILTDSPDKRVLVNGDSNVPYGEVVSVMVRLRDAGAAGVGLMTRRPEGEG